MTVTEKDLFLAILAMDSYNRGRGAGLNDEGASDANGLGSIGSKIGAATVTAETDTALDSAEVAAGFYAVAYTMSNESTIEGLAAGTTVISYRGTDSTPAGDFANYATRGWPLGGGDYFTPQTALANDFLDAVQADSAPGSVVLTGHSRRCVSRKPRYAVHIPCGACCITVGAPRGDI